MHLGMPVLCPYKSNAPTVQDLLGQEGVTNQRFVRAKRATGARIVGQCCALKV